MEIRHSVDWWQYFSEIPQFVHEWPETRGRALAIIKPCLPYLDTNGFDPNRDDDFRVLPMHGYRNTYDLLYASAHVDPTRREQGIHIRMTSANMNAYRSLGGTEGHLFEFCSKIGARPSRIDIAFDLFDFNIDILRMYEDWKQGTLKCTARTVQPFTKGVMEKDGTITEATTLYFGSRESVVMVRIYDKGKEQRVDLDWTRIELEIKGDAARAVLPDLLANGTEAVGKQMLRKFFTKIPYKFFKELGSGKSIALAPVERKLTAHDVWMHDIILPMIAKDIKEEWEGCIDRGITRSVEALVREHWTRRLMQIRETYKIWK